MALQALWAPETQFQNKNGSLLVFGKIYVQYRGRSQLAKTYRDPAGAYQNTNPLLTDNDGRVLCYADDSFSYTAVVCDFYGNELFSFDPIPCGSAGGGGSASAGTAEHWLGWNGASVAVPSGTETRLRMPAGLDNVDYDGGFLKRIESSGTEMVLEEGLYLVNAVIRFQQSSSDLTNELSNVVIHTRDFESANMQEVGATFRDEAGPDSSSDIHTISLTFIRHASVEDVGSDRLKFAVDTPNTWTSCYIQNLQIAKLGSSVNGGGTAELYDAGQYISIENHVISVTGIDPESYATHDELQSATSAFITSADLPDLSGYATEEWVLDKHYITSADIPDIPDDVVTSGELATVSGEIVNQIPSLDGYATEEYVTEHTSAFITSADIPDLSDMATETWVSGQGYLKNLFQAEYGVTRFADILEAVYNKKTVYCLIPTPWNYPSGRMAFLAYVNISDPVAPSNFFEFQYYRSNSGLDSNDSVFVYQVKPNNTWSTTERTAGNVSDWKAKSGKTQILNKPDLSVYATTSSMEEYVTEQTSAFITSADIPPIPEDVVTSAELANVSGAIEQDISDVTSAMTEALADKMDKTSSANFYPRYDNPEGYLTSIPSEYVTETEMSEYVTEHTSAFITSAEVQEYSAGPYIDITDHTISVSPVKSLVAGDNVSIAASGNNYVISAQVPQDVVTSGELATVSGEIVNQIPSLDGYATETYVTEHTSAFLTSADLPDVSDMATQTWVTEQHYITSADVPPQIEYSAGDNIDITNHVVSVTDTSQLIAGDNVSITPSGNDYIISAQVPETSGYVTEQEMNDAIQSATSAFITSADIPDIPEDVVTSGELANVSGQIVAQIPSLDGYATEQYVQDYTSGFITSADVPEYSAGQYIGITNKTISVSPVKSLVAGENVTISASGDNYVISSIGGGGTTYSAGQYVSIENDTISVTGLQPAGSYATQTWVAEQGYLTSIPSEYITETELESATSGKADTSAIPDVSNFVTQEDIDAAVSGKMDSTEASAFYPMATNPSGYLVSSDLNGYASEQYVQDYTSGFVDSDYVSEYVASQTSGKQDNLTFGYDASDKINAINGSAIAGGGSVPEGVMVESGLQYNAVGEISGYGESAIAQYGAEKQWLVHDDTIVHVTNSAQYAFGVNLSAVAQLLGIDETVLYSGVGESGAFSEPLSGFKKVEFHLSDDTIIRQVATLYPDEVVSGSYIVGAASVWKPNNSPVRVLSVSGNMNEFSLSNASYQWWAKNDGGYATFSSSPVKVVGIGRKQSN